MLPLNFRITERAIPWLFALLVVLAYGLLLFETGFYWDDWPFVWTAAFMGPASFIDSFLKVRPLLGPIFMFTTSLLPENTLAWQAFALVIRFVISLAAWWAFRQLWPQHPWQTLMIGLAFLVFPPYSQHWVAFTHINQELIPFIFYLLSLGMTGLVLRSGIHPLRRTTLALLLLALGVFPTEYFLTLEPLRFLFIYSVFNERNTDFKTKVYQSAKTWLPYMFVWLANGAWLYFFYNSGLYRNYDVEVTRDTSTLLAGFAQNAMEAVYAAGLYGWVQFIPLALQSLPAPSTLLALGVAGSSFFILLFFLFQYQRNQPFSSSSGWAWQAISMGLFGIIIGRVPSWAAGLPLTLQSSFDRFTVSMMIGACLLVAGLLTLLFRNNRLWIVTASLLVALGVGQQVFNANIFRRDWERQRSIYWQLAWRVPALQPGTILLTDELEIDYETDYSITAPINWMYAPDFVPPQLPYVVLSESRFNTGRLPALQPDLPVYFAYRPVRFDGNTSQSIVFLAPRVGCVKVLDPAFDDHLVHRQLSAGMRQAVQFSDPSRIDISAPPPSLPDGVFGSEPPLSWCYYYEKADLARQQGDWPQVTALAEQAVGQGFAPSDPTEWLPFIEAWARTGQTEKAILVSQQALEDKPALKNGLCALWQRVDPGQTNSPGCEP